MSPSMAWRRAPRSLVVLVCNGAIIMVTGCADTAKQHTGFGDLVDSGLGGNTPGTPGRSGDGGPDTSDGDTPRACTGEPQAGCSCSHIDESVPCYEGPEGTEGVGICRAGTMTCFEMGEFPTWGECEGMVTPEVDIPGDGIDQDCDDSDATEACVPDAEREVCDDGSDNDCDGLVDCDDVADCRGQRACCVSSGDEVCDDGIDNDCDGLSDCDDSDCPCLPECVPRREICDDGVDNDCDELVDCDDDADCRCGNEATGRLYAHSPTRLYVVDPATWTVRRVGPFGVSSVTDLAIDNDGSMYCITFSALYSVDPTTGAATLIGPTGASGNGLTFLDDGRLVMSGGGRLYELNRATGAATVIGSFGPGVSSSGDLTGTPAGALYLTSPGDRLVRLNRSTGRATTIGMTGFSEVYGLAYWDGVVYGFTSSGGIIAINEATGRGTSVFTGGDTYWGAAVNQLLW